jgi:sugar phosphate isomerase/epimerase
MDLKLPIAAITDEFSPDLEVAVDAMSKIGMTGAELRVLWGKNIMDLTDDELDRAKQILDGRGFQVMSIASPLLKCVLPDSPEIDSRFQHDIFASKHTFEDQPRLAAHAFEIAHRTGAKIIRVFSYWRTVEPLKCFDRIVTALGELAEKASKEDLIIGLENEHACNLATGAEAAAALRAVDHPNLKLVWDPANALVSGEAPFPDGYRLLPANRIAHVHAKDCYMKGHKPEWGPLGACGIDWKGQIAALLADGYHGYLSLETHWAGPAGDKLQGSTICGWNMKNLVAA